MKPHLGRLLTDLGERSTYDAASQCSRCGYCEQSCPTYVATGKEQFSPRGRNQIVRLLLEGKIAKDDASAREALSTCLLCGACQTTCYAHVGTPDLVLEGRRMTAEPAHPVVKAALRLLIDHPRLFSIAMKAAFLGKRLGLARLAAPVLRLLGLGALAEADAHMDEAPLRFANDVLRDRSVPPKPAFLYFAACGTNFLFPRVAEATVKVLERQGPVGHLDAGCCGLVAFNYGELDDARRAARRVIEQSEASDAPIAADCSSCVAHLKAYPQLFLEEPAWKERAARFAARIRDAVELLAHESPKEAPVALHESCRARHGQGLRPAATVGATPVKCLADPDQCCGGAGAFSLAHPELSEEILKRKISSIKQTGLKVVATSSTSCLLQLARGLRNYYPEAAVKHVSEIASADDGRGTPDGA